MRMIHFSQLPAITGGTLVQQMKDLAVGPWLLDSRKLQQAPDSVFWAIQGKNHDSHQWLATVYQKGIRQFVIEHKGPYAQLLPEANILLVENSTHAMQALAAHHRQQFQLPLLAITGSNAKTIVKEWLGQLLAMRYNVVKSPKSYNSQVGVPLAVWQLHASHQYGVFEAGISQPGEMERLSAILHPTSGLFTNIGAAHDQGFDSRQQKIEEKAKLFRHCKTIYYCQDHVPIHRTINALYHDQAQLVTWSLQDDNATYRIRKQPNTQDATTQLQVKGPHQASYTFTLPFRSDVSIENAVHCLVLLLHEGFDAAMLQTGVNSLKAIPMRLTMKQGINQCQVIDDTYNNDWAGLQVALDFMAQQKQADRRTVILSDLLQTGIAPAQLYPQVAQLLQAHQIDRLIGVGDEITAHAAVFAPMTVQCYGDTDALLQENFQQQFTNELILVKGARPFALEKVVAELQQKLHGTVLEVDLDAIVHNLSFFRRQLAADTQLMVVVKALAYGSSSFEVAHLLQHHGVNYLAVAYVDEGISLRERGITLPIMVMNPTPESFDKLLTYQLEPEVYSLRLLQALVHFLATRQQRMAVHLKLETGMHRLGITAHEVEALVQQLRTTPWIHVVGIMSHLAAASDPTQDDYTQQQATLFRQQAGRIEQALRIRTTKHLLNSAGILRFPEHQLDMVRLGIGLYGVGVTPDIARQLEVVSTLKTVISQIKTIAKGATVGYDRQGKAQDTMRVATIAIGYADGFSRALGNGQGRVMIHGQLAPVVGNVCMDMAMVDVTAIAEAAEGDEAIIFGKEHPIAEIAAAMHTIPHEVLTTVSERVRRVYYTG